MARGRKPLTEEEVKLRNEEKARKETEKKARNEPDTFVITKGQKIDFENKCEEIGIEPELALNLLLEGFKKDTFKFKIKQEFMI